MNAIKILVKGWVKVLPFYLFTLIPLFTSCSEKDDTTNEYENWQQKNEAYFEQKYQEYAFSSLAGDRFIILNLSTPQHGDYAPAHTDYILVDVLERGTGTTSPYYNDSVDIHYEGHLIPSPSYAEGYPFDKSFSGVYDPDVTLPCRFTSSSSTLYAPRPADFIKGFSTALQHMHKGDRWRVTIPHQLGYGSTEQSAIPAYSTLIFDIRMADFWTNKKGDRE